MILALAISALVALALVSDIFLPKLAQAWARHRARRRVLTGGHPDPGRERRAEQTARELLRSCVNDEEWAMYRELGLIRVWGRHPRMHSGGEYAYLIYPHQPILAYEPQTGRLLGEYCVSFPDHSGGDGSARLPDSDDVLAKWMALTSDETRLLARSNMHLPGRQLEVARVTRDLWRLSCWERGRTVKRAAELGVSTQPTEL
ncbi:MAG: hypothetical protein ACRDKL_03500 [Solirubrobacteraceae bacterium]